MTKIEDTHLPITVLDDHIDHQGFRTLRTYSYREDESGLEARRELVTTNPAIAVIAHDPTLDKFVMIRQFRLGAQMGTGNGMCVEVVAGMIEDGEAPEVAVIRELKEETGLQAQHVKKACHFLTTPGLTNEVIHLFYAQVDASNLPAEAGEESESEQTFPFLLTLEEALDAVDGNGIQNGIAMLALLWFARHQQKLCGPSI